MDKLCDEILQIILNELDDPTSFILTSKHIHNFTQDPYVRASYFISRYGKVQAFYWALGRGKLMNKEVIDILLSSGAHLSRYLVQCIIQHYYRSLVHFIKTQWVRSLDFTTVNYILSIAGEMYGNIPVSKGEDDGAAFNTLLKDSRLPSDQRVMKFEAARDIVEKYKFIPFCNKDPMMAQFPLVLAIEPRLLPFARANGFYMDHKYRNFVFRKMFEKAAIVSEGRMDEIIRNVKELTRLDPLMFLSRTVAAEICMEAKSNEAAYNALKALDQEGCLKFELRTVVHDLIKLFAKTRSVASPPIANVLRQLFTDFPSKDPIVRVVLLLQIFLSEHLAVTPLIPGLAGLSLTQYVRACKQKIEDIGLNPVKRTDLLEVLANKFAPDRFVGILEYGRTELAMSRNEVEGLIQELAIRCLEVGCKGKMLKKLLEAYTFLDDVVRERVVKKYRLNLDDLPMSEDENACINFSAPLCRGFECDPPVISVLPSKPTETEDDVSLDEPEEESSDEFDLGYIGQDTLSAMIRKDELAPTRGRRRFYDMYAPYSDTAGKLTYPADHVQVGRVVRQRFGPRSGVSAVFLMHAVVNGNPMIVQSYLGLTTDALPNELRIPITLKHFKLLARLGRAPGQSLYEDIEAGAEFYFSEEDYLTPEELTGTPRKKYKHSRIRIKMVSSYTVKTESSPAPEALSAPIPSSSSPPPSSSARRSASISCSPTPTPSGSTSRRRLRRTASTTKSYVVPDSDDEDIADSKDEMVQHVHAQAKKRKVESNMQKWIKHLTILYKEEQKKYNEKKRRVQAAAEPGTKVRLSRNEFLRSMAANLPRIRKLDHLKRQQLYGPDVADEDYSSGEEDEYQDRRTRKRRKSDDGQSINV
ncbi:hypothetical protein C8Q75DRAFT_789273 [Abortiporus biennis]|nr:hypothetical protein C8Q75DRAFT_789273 [Abortiporus biennis]